MLSNHLNEYSSSLQVQRSCFQDCCFADFFGKSFLLWYKKTKLIQEIFLLTQGIRTVMSYWFIFQRSCKVNLTTGNISEAVGFYDNTTVVDYHPVRRAKKRDWDIFLCKFCVRSPYLTDGGRHFHRKTENRGKKYNSGEHTLNLLYRSLHPWKKLKQQYSTINVRVNIDDETWCMFTSVIASSCLQQAAKAMLVASTSVETQAQLEGITRWISPSFDLNAWIMSFLRFLCRNCCPGLVAN